LDREFVALLSGVVEDVLDEPIKLRGLRFDDTKMTLRDGVTPFFDSAPRHLGVEADVGQRRLQFMRNLVYETDPLLGQAQLAGIFAEEGPSQRQHKNEAEADTEKDGE
jgi:hypothetical protein